jgi:hypothetical protein
MIRALSSSETSVSITLTLHNIPEDNILQVFIKVTVALGSDIRVTGHEHMWVGAYTPLIFITISVGGG